MPKRPAPAASALVVVRSPSGRLKGHEQITAKTVREYLPAQATVSHLRAFFERAGFSVEAPGGLGFSIVGPNALFERVFGTKLVEEKQGAVRSLRTEHGELELPIARLPKKVASEIEAVTFTAPPDFGPTDFHK